MIAILISGGIVKAEEKPVLHFSLQSTVQGEITAASLFIDKLTMNPDEEIAMSIIFSKGFLINREIQQDAIKIDDNNTPKQALVIGLDNIRLVLPMIQKSSFRIDFLAQAGIQNPIQQDKASISLVIENTNQILFSNTINLIPPNNTVESKVEKEIVPLNGYFPEEFSLKLTPGKNKTIFYSLNQSEFKEYSTPILIVNGKHILQYYGQRQSGAKEPLQVKEYQVDAMPPSVKIVSPPNKKLVNQRNLTVTVMVKDVSPLHFHIQQLDLSIISNMEGVLIEIPLVLEPGENLVPYQVIDAVGHKSEGVLTYYVDLTPPALVVYSPKKGDTVCGTRIEISGKAELGVKVMVFDQLVKTDANGNFSVQYIPSNKGINQLSIVCIDLAGNENRLNYHYYYFPGKLLEFLIGQNKAKVDNTEKEINPPPLLDSQNGEVYVPLRFVADALAFELTWNSKEGRAVLKKNKTEIELRPNDTQVRIKMGSRNEKIDLLYTPTLYKGSLMVPAEFLKKILGGEVIYELSNSRIFVNYCDKVGNT